MLVFLEEVRDEYLGSFSTFLRLRTSIYVEFIEAIYALKHT